MQHYIEKHGINLNKLQVEMKELASDSKVIGVKEAGDGIIVFLSAELTEAELTELEDAVAAHTIDEPPRYLIYDYVTQNFKGHDIENIDFKRHLARDVALNKKIYKLDNGRPEKCEYYYTGGAEPLLVAEIIFEFTSDPATNLLLRRREILRYLKSDGTKSFDIVIKDRIYDHMDLVDGEIVVQERVTARESIISGMKAFLSGAMMQATNSTLDQVIATIKPFWDEYKYEREDFVDLGDGTWRQDMIDLDLTSTPYTWLATPISPEMNIRDYIVWRLSY